MWKLKIVNKFDFTDKQIMEIPNAVAEMIFSNPTLICRVDDTKVKCYYNDKVIAIFEKI